MGLDTSHNCWHGAYSSFNRWRTKLCEVAGYGRLDDREGFGGKVQWPDDDALVILLAHSDCDGEIEWKDCEAIAVRLEQLMPALKVAGYDHAERAQQFIHGLRDAAIDKENVDFH